MGGILYAMGAIIGTILSLVLVSVVDSTTGKFASKALVVALKLILVLLSFIIPFVAANILFLPENQREYLIKYFVSGVIMPIRTLLFVDSGKSKTLAFIFKLMGFGAMFDSSIFSTPDLKTCLNI